MVDIIKSRANWVLVDYEFSDSRYNGTFATSGGIAFPRMHDVAVKPEGAVVVFAEKHGIYYLVSEFVFSVNANQDLTKCYEKTKNRRFFYSDSGSDRARLSISRDREIEWRPEFQRAPYSHEDEARHEFYSLLQEGRLKIIPDGVLYNAISNMGFQKTPPILTATFNALTGLLKFPRRKN